jgi:hypothetical protein
VGVLLTHVHPVGVDLDGQLGVVVHDEQRAVAVHRVAEHPRGLEQLRPARVLVAQLDDVDPGGANSVEERAQVAASGAAVHAQVEVAVAGGRPAPPPPPRGGGARARRGAPTKLVITEGSLTGTTVALQGQTITLGRAHDSTIVLDDDYASGRHARIYPDQDGQWIVEDLGSTNGTYLDRARLTTPMAIPPGAPIRIGKTVIELRK